MEKIGSGMEKVGFGMEKVGSGLIILPLFKGAQLIKNTY
jgi:hypothetical protein